MPDDIPEKFRRGFPHKDPYADQKALCPDAKVIFDVGANIGATSLTYRRLFPDAAIHAFEPFPAAFGKLEARFATDGRVRCVRKAVSSSSGDALLHVNSMDVTNALSPIRDEAFGYLPDNFAKSGSISVETTKLDDYSRVDGIDRIDILKMDAQGSELDILRGGERLLSEGRVKLVYSELIFVPVYEQQAAFHEIAAFLAPFGFRLFDFFGFTYDPSGQLKWGMRFFYWGEGDCHGEHQAERDAQVSFDCAV
jgi:FkbM family methyltransferase